jgi:hypothetical protein
MALRSNPYKRTAHSKPYDRLEVERIWYDGYQAGLAKCSHSFRSRGSMADMGTYHKPRETPYSRPVKRNFPKQTRDPNSTQTYDPLKFPGYCEAGEDPDEGRDPARHERKQRSEEWAKVTNTLLLLEEDLQNRTINGQPRERVKYDIAFNKYLLHLYRTSTNWDAGRAFERNDYGTQIPDYY